MRIKNLLTGRIMFDGGVALLVYWLFQWFIDQLEGWVPFVAFGIEG